MTKLKRVSVYHRNDERKKIEVIKCKENNNKLLHIRYHKFNARNKKTQLNEITNIGSKQMIPYTSFKDKSKTRRMIPKNTR